MTRQFPGEAPPAVAAARTVGGVVLVIVGIALALFGAFWFFLVPWFGWATEGFGFHMADWADIGGAVVGIGGFVVRHPRRPHPARAQEALRGRSRRHDRRRGATGEGWHPPTAVH